MSKPVSAAGRNVENAYPLSPLQEGILYHSLSSPETAVYVSQAVFFLEQVDTGVLEQAWQGAVDRHPVLRTAFAWQTTERALQVVGRDVRLPVAREDWRGVAESAQAARLTDYMAADQRRGFTLSKAPLMRLATIQQDAGRSLLVWTFHHILLDGWSVALILKEVTDIYQALCAGRDPGLAVPRRYRDYIEWLGGQDMDRAEQYWRRRLRGVSSPTPLDLGPPLETPADGSPYDKRAAQLSESITETLRTTARGAQVTLNTLVQGAWAIALSRYSGTEDVLYGTTVSGRPADLEGVESMVGLFINSLPTRVRVPPGERLLPWLRSLQVEYAELRQYEYSPLVAIQGWSEVPRGVPLFETLVAFENYPMPTSGAGGNGRAPLLGRGAFFDNSHYPLSLAVRPDREMSLSVLYDRRRFDEATVERVLGHLTTLLSEIAADPDRRLGELPFLPEAEERQLLAGWNGTAADYPRSRTVVDLFREQVELTPEAPAVVDGGDSLTYGELDRRSSALARSLQAWGVGVESVVGVCTGRSIEMMVAVLGVVKAGGAYLPLDPDHPPERLAFMLRDSGVDVVLTRERLRDRLSRAEVRAVPLDGEWEAPGAETAELRATVTSQNLAYVIYTSGSTGQPKGVQLAHGGLVNLALWHARTYDVGPADRATQLASPAFDASVWEVWPYLVSGASVHIPTEDTRSNASRLVDWLAAERITHSFLPTPLAEAALEEPALAGVALRYLLTGGDKLHRVEPKALPFRLVNHYGPTEGTVVATCVEVAPGSKTDPPIGRPIANTRAYVLDEQGRPVPRGVAGELFIGGDGLARGYLGRPDLTAQMFLPDPFSGEPGARLYRTGDRVRHLADGTIEFLGRQDHQVKLRGFRVELGEIESALAEDPAVRDAVALLREDSPGDRRLVAYVTPRDGQLVTADRLTARLRETLPEHMVPSVTVILDALPLTPNGKIDRRALPAPEPVTGGEDAFAAPRTPVEEGLAEIWSRVLGVARVGVHDSFFALGGHSLLATRVISQVRRIYGVDLPLRVLFEAPTVAGLAQGVEEARGSREDGPPPLIEPVSREGELPLSFAQQRLWFLDQMGAGAAYNVPWALRLAGSLDVAALRQSLDAIARRHETLRTAFPAVAGRARQRVAPPSGIGLVEIDVSRSDPENRETEARRLAGEEAGRPFDLARGPLVRATLLRLGDTDHVLLLTIHHILADGWSMGVLIRELAAHYRGFLSGHEAVLPELPIQYADFARWQREWLSGERLERQLAYWRQQLGGDMPRLELPTDRPRPDEQTYQGGRHGLVLPKVLSDELTALCRREGATLFMVLLAGLKALLARYTGQRDIVVGSPIANRNRSETEELIGFFVNSLVMRTDLAGDPSFRELLGRVRETALGAYDHQDVPFEKLVEELHPGRDLGQNPLFQVMFAVQNAPWEALELPGLVLRPFERETRSSRFDLEIHVWESGGALAAGFIYNADLFDGATVERLGRHWLTLLEAAVKRPDTRLADLPLLGPDEHEEVLALGRGRRPDYPRDSAVPREFEDQAARTPDRVAVSFSGERLTCAELNRRANQLGHYLARSGVAPGVRVGLCVERSLELVVGLLGILKAGGAYVPLDPDYPRERLAMMVEDARPAVLVTQEAQRPRLPGSGWPIVCLDRDAPAIAQESTENLDRDIRAEDLAYVTFTSGSTGVPKGVEITHRGVLRLVQGTDYAELGPQETLLQLAPVSFDASTLEVWGALITGGRLVVFPERVPSARELGAVLAREQVSTLWLTASLFNVVVDESPEVLAPVRQLLIGGEALSVDHVRRAQERLPQTQIINGYGPTENTTFTCCHPIPTELPAGIRSIPIGRPIASTDVYVLDERLEPVPPGVPGELFIGGDGLARGYLNRPELTAERFPPHPFATTPGERLYRTGDRVRWLRDRTLEFLGRTDDQVKIRGFRIELGEIQSILARQPEVREAAVLVREGDAASEKRLVAYVVPEAAEDGAQGETADRDRRVTQWRNVYDSVIYDQVEAAAPADPTLNLAGWNSSYTGRPIPEDEMREQVDQAVERILAGRPRRVLEIGCGTGLLLFRIAPHCERYVGTDFSSTALEYVRRELRELPDPWAGSVELWERRAEDFEGIEPGGFDAVLLNSVVQYFPDIEYLKTVLEGALQVLAPGGRVFVGDVRHLPLLESFATSVQLHQATAEVSRDQLRERVREQMAQEQELLVDPAFFLALARQGDGAGRVHVSPKRGRARNELTKYRYDAILEVGSAPEGGSPVWLDWPEDGLSLARLRQMLVEMRPEALGVRRVPNARTQSDVQAWAALARDGEGPPDDKGEEGVDPEELWALTAELPYVVDLSWAASHLEGRFDALFRRHPVEGGGLPGFPVGELAPRPWASFANDPLQATRVRGLVPQLRRSLQERLPDYMVPGAFVLLDTWPLTANGKVDTRALAALELARPDVEEAFEGPRTPVEEELARIWAQVLGVARVGTRDNFFELGGDSILSIQIVARASQAGLHLTPKQIFQHQTIAELARVVGTARVVEAEQGQLRGAVPLTPIQHWFLEQELPDASHFNQALLLEVRADLGSEVLEDAVRALEEHHDALRLRFERGALGWRQEIAEPNEDTYARVDLSSVEPGREAEAIQAAADDAQRSLSLERGPIFRVRLLELGHGRSNRLLIVIHHQAVDGVSWRILLEDLETACAQRGRGESVRLPPKTSSFRQWAEALRSHGRSEELKRELPHWTAVGGNGGMPLPVDGPRDGNTVSSTDRVSISLEPDETQALLQEVPGVYHTQITDVLLTGLARSLESWTGRRDLLLDLEGHGREELFEGMDLSRTVGWFTTVYPVRLKLEEGAGVGETLRSVKEQLRSVPRRGLGYGVLRYLGNGEGEPREDLADAEISFNYLGQFDQALGELALFGPAVEGTGDPRSGRQPRRHLLEVNGVVAGGALRVSWIFSERTHRRATIEALAQGFRDELRAIITHCRSPEAGGYTPSDFPLARVDQVSLDGLLAGERAVEDVYPLSPLQEGLLFHSLLDPASGVYVEQLSFELREAIDTPALARAWQEVVDRYPVLRTRFAWEGLPRPLQVVEPSVSLPWRELDWRGRPPEQQEADLGALLETDRGEGFDLARAPLTRVACVRISETRHRLVWTFHHLVLDGWSLPVIFRTLYAVYEAFRRGEEGTPEPVRPFREYIAWLEEQDLDQAQTHWRQTLAGFMDPTPLPFDRAPGRRHEAAAERGVRAFALAPATTASLKALGREHQITLGTFVQAAWALLLGRCSGQTDVVFGVNVSGRPASLPGVESMVGLFVNTLPLRARVAEDESLLSWLKDLQAEQLDHRQFEYSPLVRVQGWSEVAAGQPLFESILAFENYPMDPAVQELGGATGFQYRGTTSYPLSVTAAASGPRLSVRVGYDRTRFSDESIARLQAGLSTLLEGMAEGARQPVGSLALLSEEERRRVLVEWNQTRKPAPSEARVHRAFESQVERTPEAVAVVFEDRQLTYGELNWRANQLAHALRSRGVGPDTLVGVCLERSPELVIALLGILKAGGAYVPLDPDYPRARLQSMIDDAGAPVLLTVTALVARLPPGTPVECLDADGGFAADRPTGNPDDGADPDHLAYVMYTSGSTGRPKGVMISHRSLANHMAWMQSAFPLGEADRVLQKTPLSFDASVWEFWAPLLAGSRLVLAGTEAHRDPARLVEAVRRHGISVLQLVPTLLRLLLDEPTLDECRTLRRVFCGGEALPVEAVARFSARLGAELHNLYGPTEATIDATSWSHERGTELESVPIGRPIHNLRTYVLDQRLRPTPVGVAGELFLGGAGLARGYWRRPEWTAAAFVPDPFGNTPGGRLYRTGDRVRFRSDGSLEFLGRIDHQVKVRGNRIELGEIEATLRSHPAVGEAVVLAPGTAPGESRLVAYLTAEGLAPSVAELRSALKERLPAYMVPSAFVILEALPLTPNGKVDRRALGGLDGPVEPGATYEAPRTSAENVLAQVWSELLRVPAVGIRDDFFELGGDSILSLQIVARAREAGLRVSLKQLFEHPTVAELAEVAGAVAEVEAEQGPVTGDVPLTPVQAWFFEQEIEPVHRYNQGLILELSPDVEPEVLEHALSALEHHHDALRMRFVRRGSGWVQECAAPTAPAPFRRVDVSDLGDDGQRRAIEETAEQTQGSLDLEHGPVWRAVLFERGRGVASRLLTVVHHLVVDGVSWRLLLEDLHRVTEQLSQGRPITLPPKTTSFKRWAERLVDHAGSGALEEELPYWQEVANTSAPPLPVDHPGDREANTAATARTVSVFLDEEETRALRKDVPAAYRTQIGDALLAALVEAFHAWTGQTELEVDLEGHGREDLLDGVDVSRTVGWFTTIYPVRLRWVDGGPGEALKAVKEQLREIPNRGIGYGLLRHLQGKELRSGAGVSFNYLGQFDQVLGEAAPFPIAAERAGPGQDGRSRRPYLLELNGLILGGRLRFDWTYSTAVHDPATVESLARRFEQALRGLIEHCRSGARGCTPSDFPLARLDSAVLARVLAGQPDVEEICPLSPMQEGMLFHSLATPRGGQYLEQGAFELEGPLDAGALRRAWEQAMRRHGVLRTRFAWRGLERPLQVVERRVTLPWDEEDWSSLEPDERVSRFEGRLRTEREQGLALDRAPLMKMALVRMAAESHRLIWSYHHALLDGWSAARLWTDILMLYRSSTRGESARLGDVRPYRDFVAWLERQDLAAAEGYWRRELAGFTSPTPLLGDAGDPRGGGVDGEPARRTFTLGAASTKALTRLARRHGLTPNTLVQGAWAILLSRCSGERGVVFGVTGAGRPAELPGVESMVGLFINTLPARVEVPDERPLLEWLKDLQARQVEQRQYEYSPLWRVQGWSEIEPGRALFDSLLVFENYPVDPSLRELAHELRVRGIGARERTNYPLTLVASSGEQFALRFLYEPLRFTADAIDRLGEYLQRLLEAFARRADARLGDLGLLGEEEERRILVGWNDTTRPYARERTIADVFHEQAAARPEATAVSIEGRRLTYSELNRRSNQLAHHLRGLGVGPEVRVGICVERSVELVVGLLGIVKAGGAYVPLDPSYPSERLAFMLEDSEARVLLTQERLESELPGHEARVVRLDRDWEEIAEESGENLASGLGGENLAYVIYTSGSTGTPKGVEVSHRAVNRLVLNADYVRVEATDRVAQASNASFDAATFEVWGALLTGACLVGISREVSLVPRELGAALREQGVTILFLTTALFNAVAREDVGAFSGLRHLLFGGEAVDPTWVKQALGSGGPERLLHVYGPTETTTFATWQLVMEVSEGATTIPIGRPIANTRVYVLDERLNAVPVGVPGELYIGGDGVARGYQKRPGLTAEKFVPDPFGEEHGGRLYRTGDRVRWHGDGVLEFLGRLDAQVKLRGFRVELGEIASVLGQHPGVQDVVVVLREDHPGEQRLVAYVTAPAGRAAEVDELRSHVKARLPEYMVPSTFVRLGSLPLSPNGKVNRRALPAPEGRPLSDEPLVPPRNDLEETIANTWREVLHLEEVGVHDNFFDLGGHSLALVRVHERLMAALRPRELTIVELFEHPTVASLAEHVRTDESAADREEAPVRARRLQEGAARLDRRRERRRTPPHSADATE